MKISRFALAACLGLISPGAKAGNGSVSADAMFVHASQLRWQPALGLPSGATMASLYGDPAKPGPITLRLRLPAGTKVAPHWHPQDETVTVLSGTAEMGMGDTYDLSRMSALGAGDFHFLPKGHRHFVRITTATTVEIHTTGPWGITYVSPEDDPRNQ